LPAPIAVIRDSKGAATVIAEFADDPGKTTEWAFTTDVNEALEDSA